MKVYLLLTDIVDDGEGLGYYTEAFYKEEDAQNALAAWIESTAANFVKESWYVDSNDVSKGYYRAWDGDTSWCENHCEGMVLERLII